MRTGMFQCIVYGVWVALAYIDPDIQHLSSYVLRTASRVPRLLMIQTSLEWNKLSNTLSKGCDQVPTLSIASLG